LAKIARWTAKAAQTQTPGFDNKWLTQFLPRFDQAKRHFWAVEGVLAVSGVWPVRKSTLMLNRDYFPKLTHT